MIHTSVTSTSRAETRDLIRHSGVTGIKLFMAYPDSLMVDDGAIFRAMWQCGEDGGLVCLHAENGTVIQALIEEALAAGQTGPRYHAATRPSLMEGEAVHRAIAIAELLGTPVYLVHLSTEEAVAEVTLARDRGMPVYAETCPHYLFLDESAYDTDDFVVGAKVVMTPPLRGLDHRIALWRALRSDDLQVVSTDHCPFCVNEASISPYHAKRAAVGDFSRIPNGAPGLETRLPLLFDAPVAGRGMSLDRLIALTATSPAKLFGLFPRKGTIAIGSDADLVLFDPNATTTVRAADHHSRVDYSLFEGHRLRGAIRKVFLRGELIVDGRQWAGRPGRGRIIKRGARGRPQRRSAARPRSRRRLRPERETWLTPRRG
jgi:dihydropyrimidinase